MKTFVREIEIKDVELIADYWSNANAEYLKGMGADINKLPKRSDFIQMLTNQIQSDYLEKKSYAVIWEMDEKQIGHSNINDIDFGNNANMHLHLWNGSNRKRGLGTEFVKKSLPFYFEKFNLKEIICEPYALNIAPNKTLEKVGFEFVKKYKTIPGSLNFEQEVNQWKFSKEKLSVLGYL